MPAAGSRSEPQEQPMAATQPKKIF